MPEVPGRSAVEIHNGWRTFLQYRPVLPAALDLGADLRYSLRIVDRSEVWKCNILRFDVSQAIRSPRANFCKSYTFQNYYASHFGNIGDWTTKVIGLGRAGSGSE